MIQFSPELVNKKNPRKINVKGAKCFHILNNYIEKDKYLVGIKNMKEALKN